MRSEKNEKNKKNDFLCQARAQKGWTQGELADRLGASKDAVKAWEHGRRSPSLTMRRRLCETFGMTAAQLGLEQNEVQQSPEEEPTADLPGEQDQNRRRMLKRVQTCWVSGVLDHSRAQYQGSLLPVRLRECPSAVVNPWATLA